MHMSEGTFSHVMAQMIQYLKEDSFFLYMKYKLDIDQMCRAANTFAHHTAKEQIKMMYLTRG